MKHYCYACKEEHDESAFSKKDSRTSHRPVQGWCKEAMAAYGKKYRASWKKKREKARRG